MYARQMPPAEAVERAVDECIKEGILSDFLRKNRNEVIAMSIFEYDEEAHHKLLYEEGVEDGVERGKKLGLEEGIERGKKLGLEQGEIRLNKLYSILLDMGRLDDLKRATQDKAYQEQLMNELLPGELLNI